MNNNSFSSLCYELSFKLIGDDRGSLISIEELKNIPFAIKRVYYIFDTKSNVIRGAHAHTKLHQVLISVSGQCTVKICDGKQEKAFILNDPTKGLFIGENLWRAMYDFSHDCVLMVLANEYYDEEEYIRNYDDFLALVNL